MDALSSSRTPLGGLLATPPGTVAPPVVMPGAFSDVDDPPRAHHALHTAAFFRLTKAVKRSLELPQCAAAQNCLLDKCACHGAAPDCRISDGRCTNYCDAAGQTCGTSAANCECPFPLNCLGAAAGAASGTCVPQCTAAAAAAATGSNHSHRRGGTVGTCNPILALAAVDASLTVTGVGITQQAFAEGTTLREELIRIIINSITLVNTPGTRRRALLGTATSVAIDYTVVFTSYNTPVVVTNAYAPLVDGVTDSALDAPPTALLHSKRLPCLNTCNKFCDTADSGDNCNSNCYCPSGPTTGGCNSISGKCGATCTVDQSCLATAPSYTGCGCPYDKPVCLGAGDAARCTTVVKVPTIIPYEGSLAFGFGFRYPYNQWFEFSKGPQSTIAVVDTTPAATTTPALLSTLTAGASPYAVRLAVGPPTSTAPRQAIPYIMYPQPSFSITGDLLPTGLFNVTFLQFAADPTTRLSYRWFKDTPKLTIDGTTVAPNLRFRLFSPSLLKGINVIYEPEYSLASNQNPPHNIWVEEVGVQDKKWYTCTSPTADNTRRSPPGPPSMPPWPPPQDAVDFFKDAYILGVSVGLSNTDESGYWNDLEDYLPGQAHPLDLWPCGVNNGGRRELVREWSFQCPTCTYKRNNKPAKNPVTTAIRVREVFELQQIDLCDFNSWGHPVYRYVLTIVDHFSKTVWLRPLKSKESAEIAKHLRQLWADTQRPTKLHSDNGREFDGDVAALAKSLGVRTVHGRPYKPTTQGLVENMNQNMQKWMRGFAPGSLDLLDEPSSGAEDGASDGEQPSGSEELGCNEEEPDTPDGPAPSPSPAKCQRRGAAAPRRPAAKRQHPGAAALQPAKRQRRAVDQQQPQLADGDVVPPQASIPAQQAGSSRVKRAPVPNTQLRGFILEQQQQRSTPRRPAAAGVAAAAAAAAGGSSGSDSDSEEGAALLLNLGLAAGSPGAEAANEEEQAAFQQRAALAAARGAVTTQQPKTWGKIERPRNTRGAVTKEFAVGDCVVLVLAKGQVPEALFKQLACRVVKVHANGTYTLRSNHGVLDHQYPGKELVAAPQNEESAAAPRTSSRVDASGQPPSWPSAAARAAAYGSSPRETAADVPAALTGRLPPWLNGTYIRNGPGTLEGMTHRFDGYAMLTRLDINGRENTVHASHRFLESEAWKHYAATGRMRWREFATPPKYRNVLEKVAGVTRSVLGAMGFGQRMSDNAAINVVQLKEGGAVALTETVIGTFRINPATLATEERVRYQDGLKGDLTTAHPQRMPDGSLVNIVSAIGHGFTLCRQPAGAFEQRQVIARVPHRRPLAPSWVHDFPATATHAVIPEMPLRFDLKALVRGGSSEYVFTSWHPADGALLHAIDLRSGAVKSFRAPPFFVFHWANAFHTQGGRLLHLDACLYEDPQIVNDLYLEPLRAGYAPGVQPGRAYLRRLTLDLDAPDGSELPPWEALVADEAAGPSFEFPMINLQYRGMPYRFVYAACAVRPTNANNAVAKFDTQEKTYKIWHRPGQLVGEPTFVPARGATAEDEGVVLAVLVQADGTTVLAVLDGETLQEVALAELPLRLTLSQPCVLKTPAIVDPREAPAAVANATAEAFAECSDLPETQSCDAIAADKAEPIAYAVAHAFARGAGTLSGVGCVGAAATASTYAFEDALAYASAQICARVAIEDVDREKIAASAQQTIEPPIASALATALAAFSSGSSPAMARGFATCLLAALLLLAVAAVDARKLRQSCKVSAVAIADATSQPPAVASAASQAFSQCSALPKTQSCDSVARAEAEAIAYAVARAAAFTAGSVEGGPGCKGQAQAEASAKAQSYAQAFATALADAGCGGNAASVSSSAFQEAVATASAQASTLVVAEGGSAEASASSVQEAIQPAIASALATALASCA
ncbi:Carotenoid cleavage dioxygenase 8 isoform B [Micractinium conductrix]|uniref:Carotenoid cleavage dioxygenase 8 isoform B n=1 Tax=Micractinium conductrix TaxID=554055 RepID=A0A2P6VCV2_9CHLO|nr:Carotenoid cleavage dioxygenase 8 isoform B [Micractinium conductrix]|eukprot:PSC71918.1 Carotenoid cleavage dioxygenase 8 isoform B [Micractinium conductrix]